MQFNNHVVRRNYSLHVAKMDIIMATGNYGSADSYYWYKNRERELAAELANKSIREIDPMHYWYGGQSN